MWSLLSSGSYKYMRTVHSYFPEDFTCTLSFPAGPRRLALRDLSGCFTLAATGVLLAVVVLLGELLVGRITTKASSKITHNDEAENEEQTIRKTKKTVTHK